MESTIFTCDYPTQDYASYTQTDHKVWATLYNRQMESIAKNASAAFRKGLAKLPISADRIPDIDVINISLMEICGWQLQPVHGLIPIDEFLILLNERKFPVTISIRKPENISYSESPDIFHDLFGHVAFLTIPEFADFTYEFSCKGIKFLDNPEALEKISRLYWYTFEMGLIREHNKMKIYGGAIMTSATEIENVQSDKTIKTPFSLETVLSTGFDLELQSCYFYIESFDQLLNCLDEFENLI